MFLQINILSSNPIGEASHEYKHSTFVFLGRKKTLKLHKIINKKIYICILTHKD